jgi:hypothetical protein
MTHELKTLPQYWDAVQRGEKTFEVRRDDRGFQKGDVLELVRHDGDHEPDCLVLPTEVIRTMRAEGLIPGKHNHREYLMEHLFGTPVQRKRRKMTHKELVELQRDLYRLERQARNMQLDGENYESHEQAWFGFLAERLRAVSPLVDAAQRKQGRKEERMAGEDKSH